MEEDEDYDLDSNYFNQDLLDDQDEDGEEDEDGLGGCCPEQCSQKLCYDTSGRLRMDLPPDVIYECNSGCGCASDGGRCPNRVVQFGRVVRLAIFRTFSTGWGLKTLEPIPMGTFVCILVGEMIPYWEVLRRSRHFELYCGFGFPRWTPRVLTRLQISRQ
ncbi:MAG: SET domain-containing protein [Gammaproteobacteria bacterium]|nr:SET domain-containing protein [Gammaproteobacteria bacterium]